MISTSTIRISVVVAAGRHGAGRPAAAHRVRPRLRQRLQRPAAGAHSDAHAGRLCTRVRGSGVAPLVWQADAAECLDDSPHVAVAARPGGRVPDQEAQASADDVVRETGWVFNNVTGDSGRRSPSSSPPATTRCRRYLEYLRAAHGRRRRSTLVEIGVRHRPHDLRLHPRVRAGDRLRPRRRRSSSAAARRSARFGKVDRLRTVHVADGRTLDLARRLRRRSCSATSRCSTAPLDDALALAGRGGAGRPARRPDRAQLPGSPPRPTRGRGPGSARWCGASFRIPSLGDRLARARGSRSPGLAGLAAAPRSGDRSRSGRA